MNINDNTHYLWRVVDHEGEVLDSVVTKRRDRRAAFKFLRKLMKRHGCSVVLTTDRLWSYGATLRDRGLAGRPETGCWINNWADTPYLPLRRRERGMLRFRRRRSLQKFAAVHATVCNHFRSDHQFASRPTFKQTRTAALAEWRGFGAT